MSLSLVLNNSLSSLNVNQQALATLSQNIANVNTPGYSRKIVQQETRVIGGVGSGVRIEDITRRVDQYLIRAAQVQSSVVGRTSTNNSYADRTQLMLGNPGASNSLNSYITRYFNQLQALSQTPDDSTIKSGVVNNAQGLARQISQLAQNLQDLRYEADQDIATALSSINSDLLQIASLNTQIVSNKAIGRTVTELEDNRDQLVRDISQYMDIQLITRSNGAINIAINGISILDDSVYRLSYTPASSVQTFVNEGALNPLTVRRIDESGNPVGATLNLVSGGVSSSVVSGITNGKIKALMEQRDRQLPQMLDQLDLLAAQMRDEVNRIHNTGSSFPGASSYTGTRALIGSETSEWSGSVRIALLNQNGLPANSPYNNQPGGLPPLNIDLSTLNGGAGAGTPSLQSIINEINQYYGVQQNKLSIGNLSNIRLASSTNNLPASSSLFSFDLDLENLSTLDSTMFVTGVQVLNSTGGDITSVSTPAPSVAIASSGSFTTTSGSSDIVITTASAHGLSEGDKIYLPDIAAAISPATDLNGIPLSELSDKIFTISNVTSTSFEISVSDTVTASSGGAVAATGASILTTYGEVGPGEATRTGNNITVNLGSAPASPYYTIVMNVAVQDEDGNVSTSQVSYRVENNQSGIRNKRYPVTAATGDGSVVTPSSQLPLARALMVDEDGNELPTSNGSYVTDRRGYLKIQSLQGDYVIAIDSLNSSELGRPNDIPPKAATNYGFSHYFGLNNFFADARTEDTSSSSVRNAALNFAIEQRLVDDPSLISTGQLTLVEPPQGANPYYTYERTIGNQAVVSALANLSLTNLAFAATGGLGAVSQTLSAYAGQIVSVASINATQTKNSAENEQKLMEGFEQRELGVSGVNLDEELANTVIYQNAYSASARLVSVVSELFDSLLQAT